MGARLVLTLLLLLTGFNWAAPARAQNNGNCDVNTIRLDRPAEGQLFEGNNVPIAFRVVITNRAFLEKIEIYRTDPQIYPNNQLVTLKWVTENNYITTYVFDHTATNTTFAEGENSVWAKAYFKDSSGARFECPGSPTRIVVHKPPPPSDTLVMFVEPSSVVTAASSHVELRGYTYLYANGNYTQVYTQEFTWATTFGTLVPSQGAADFVSSTVGSGTITVRARYQGREVSKQVPVSVYQQPPPESTQTVIPTTVRACIERAIGAARFTAINAGTSQPTEEEFEKIRQCFAGKETYLTEKFLPPTPALKTPELETCLKKVVGLTRFYEINSGKNRPTSAELEKSKPCFEKSNRSVPKTFAPIAADKAALQAVPVNSKKVNIELLNKKEVEKTDGVKAPAIILKGKSLPKKPVYLYIFSDPLVFTVDTDENGNWTYTLSDPLEPGQHEVYVTLEENTNAFVRSDPLLVSVARAAPSDTNPAGESLDLENPYFDSRRLYVIYATTLVLLGLALVFLLRREMFGRKHALKVKAAQNGSKT